MKPFDLIKQIVLSNIQILEKFIWKIHMLFSTIVIILFRYSLTVNDLPYMELSSTISIPSSISLGFDSCTQFQITQNRLYRLGQSGVIGSWLKSGSGYIEQTSMQTNPWSDKIEFFSITKNQNQIIYNQINSRNYFIINSNDLSSISSGVTLSADSLTTITQTSTNYIVTNSNDSTTAFQGLYSHAYNEVTLPTKVTIFVGNQMRSKLDPTGNYLLLWNYAGKYAVYDLQTALPSLKKISTATSSFTTFNDAEFSSDGTRLVLEFDNLRSLTVLQMTGFTVLATLAFGSVIKKVQFADTNSIIAVFHDSLISYYAVDTLTLLFQRSSPTVSQYIQIDILNKKAYEATVGSINVHNLVCPTLTYFSSTTSLECVPVIPVTDCVDYSSLTGQCITCTGNLVVVSNVCVQGGASTCPQNCAICVGTICSQCNSKYTLYKNKCYQQKSNFIVDKSIAGFQFITPFITYIMLFMQFFPVIRFFLRFVNFWNLSSLYMLLEIPIPKFLQKANHIVFSAVNTQLGEFVGIQTPKYKISNKQVTNSKLEDYQIDYDVVKPNFENAVYVTGLVLIVIFLFCSKNCLKKGKYKFIYTFLRFNKLQVIGGQIIGLISLIFLPGKEILDNFNFSCISQKLNSAAQIVIIFAAALLPFFYLWILIQKNKAKQKAKREGKKFSTVNVSVDEKSFSSGGNQSKDKLVNKRQSKAALKQSTDFWQYFINVSIPILVIIPTPIPFFIVNSLVFSLIFSNSRKVKNYRLNTIVLSLYFPSFHLMYFIMYVVDNYWIHYYAGVTCLVLFLLGGIHQLITLLVITPYELIVWIKNVYIKASQQVESPQKNQEEFIRYPNRKDSIVINTNKNIKRCSKQRKKSIPVSVKEIKLKHAKSLEAQKISDADLSGLIQMRKNISYEPVQKISKDSFLSSNNAVTDAASIIFSKSLQKKNSTQITANSNSRNSVIKPICLKYKFKKAKQNKKDDIIVVKMT